MPARWAIASSRSGPTRAKTLVAASLSETVIIRRSSAAVAGVEPHPLVVEALQLGGEDHRLDDAGRLEQLMLVATVERSVGRDDREGDPPSRPAAYPAAESTRARRRAAARRAAWRRS